MKKRKTARVCTCVLWVLLLVVSLNNLPLAISPFSKFLAGQRTISELSREVHAAYVDSFSFKTAWIDLNGAYARMTGRRVYHGVSLLKNGMLDRDGIAPIDTDMIAQGLVRFFDALAERGILSVLIEMPFNLAVLDVNAADGIREKFPQIESWYMAGHSLGGSMAASYMAKHKDDFDGMIMLAAYSTADLTDSRVLSIYGTEDGVMNFEKYNKYKKNLPENFSEAVIVGGNHAGFGMYGPQEGDGKATITTIEQIEKTVDAILNFINEE